MPMEEQGKMNRRQLIDMGLKLGLMGGTLGTMLAQQARAKTPDVWPKSPFLEGNYRPVNDELTLEDLPVEGEIPEALSGIYVRTGPNPRFPPIKNYHWFDGDGMLHAAHVQNGRVSYRNRYVRTAAFQLEEKAGQSLWPSITEPPFMGRAPKGSPSAKNAANTAMLWYNQQLLTLWEGGNPHAIQVPSLETVGETTFDGALRHALTAHPKLDPVTGELVLFGYDVIKKPYLHYSVLDKNGALKHTTTLELPRPIMMHDFAITERYSVFMDLPEVFTLRRALMGRNPLHFEPKYGSRFGILPRHGKPSDMRWFEVQNCFVFHVMAAWEEQDEVVVVGSRYDQFPEFINGEEYLGPLTGHSPQKAYLYRWRFNLATGAVKEDALDDTTSEFPRIHPGHIGQKTRFGYSVTSNPPGLFKYDLETGAIGRLLRPTHRLGEPVFVPHPAATAEDHGWVVTYAYDSAQDKSEFWVIDAQNFEAGPVARVLLPRRIPFGFHGTWVPGGEI